MKHPAPQSTHEAVSLLEVLIAVTIIAVAVYGLLVSLSAQQIAEGRARDTKVLKNLHYQMVREYLKNQRYTDATNMLTAGISCTLASPALGQDIVYFHSSQLTNVGHTASSCLHIEKNGQTTSSSAITIYYPYTQWGRVQP
jgi:Tfp pilus assembly protein PilV